MDPLTRLEQLEPAAPLADVLAFYDGLPPVTPEAMIGRWKGGEIATGHLYDGLLGPSGWWGKDFRSPDEVDPLLFERDGKLFAGNPALIPLGLIERFPRLAKSAAAARLFRSVSPLLRTNKPRARLRLLTYRGATSAAMIYDAHPIADCFRSVTPDVLLGAMDIRGHSAPYMFTLRRVAAPSLRGRRPAPTCRRHVRPPISPDRLLPDPAGSRRRLRHLPVWRLGAD